MVGRRRTLAGIAAVGTALACGPRREAAKVVAPPAPEDAGAAEAEAGPHELDGGARFIPNADRVIAMLRPRFKRCYERGLMREKDLQGKVVVKVRVDAVGHVESAEVGENEGLGAAVGECIRAALESATFEAPGATSTLNVPVTFLKQHEPNPKKRR